MNSQLTPSPPDRAILVYWRLPQPNGQTFVCTSYRTSGGLELRAGVDDEVCPHVEQWPMDEIDREVLATLTEDVLSPELAEEVVASAHQAFEAARRPARDDRVRRELAAIEREHARLTEAIATGTQAIPVLVERLRSADLTRADLRGQLERKVSARPPSWREIERRIRKRLADLKSTLAGDVGRARQAFREGLLTTPILFTPTVERGYRAIRFEGRWGVEAVFGKELVTRMASPPGFEPGFQP